MCKNENDNFIMLPTVNFCFKERMQNPKVRKASSQQSGIHPWFSRNCAEILLITNSESWT